MSVDKQSLKEQRDAYWSANLKIIGGCLVVWATVSLVLGILLAPALNSIYMAGYPLGFWIAQQGSIYVFIALIFFYAWRMNKLDREFNVYEE